MDEQALSGIKVIDLTQHITGPFCTKLLADYGADVIKIEKPETGDMARHMGPFFRDEVHIEKSGLFLCLNTNKRGITLNIKTNTGRAIIKKMVREADILVESFRPGVMEALGLGYEVLAEINPRLVMASISNFGQTGPYRDFKASELVVYGLGGAQYMCGDPEREPQKQWGTIVLHQAGITAANAIMGALFVAELQGEGQYVDISITEALAAGVDRLHTNILAYSFNKEIQPRSTIVGSYPPGNGPFPCQDGYVDMVMMQPPYIPRVRELLGHPAWLEDPQWDNPQFYSQPENKDNFNVFYIGWLADKTREEVVELAEQKSLLGAPMNNIDDVFNDRHFNERGVFIPIEHPDTGVLKYAARAFRMSETDWRLKRPAPRLGQHNEEVYSNMGYSITELKQAGAI